jgi:hypothetical protein
MLLILLIVLAYWRRLRILYIVSGMGVLGYSIVAFDTISFWVLIPGIIFGIFTVAMAFLDSRN